MDEEWRRRAASQPLDLPSFGSTFRNPPNDFAGRLLEAAGLKGERIGGAEVSPRHANFVVNVGGATARDVLLLMQRMRARVRERFEITLETEVRLVGDFADDEKLD
jgi:UDP-N-acetylmuramate dehydrogenase